jgi:hypothetical protein
MGRKRESGDLIDLLGRYLRQETVDPLRASGRVLINGILSALFSGLGLVLLAIGGLRGLQEIHFFVGWWSWLPYLMMAAALSGVTALALSRIGGERGFNG